ncbi:MAG TPA: Trk system potassium transporter TrkA [Mogibacterium sp.]|nr:Trk system potassium transporter TrkA [Mogibacterium sp.]
MKIAILGAGKLGINVMETLLDGDYDISVVDINEDKINRLSQNYDIMAYVGDIRTTETLRNISIDSYDFVLCCTSSDDVNIIAASFSKALGCKKSIARVIDPEHMNQLDLICHNFNIDAVISPDILITAEIYHYLVEKYAVTSGIFSTKRIAMVEVEASKDPRLINMPIKNFRNIFSNILVAGISRLGKIIIPHGNDTILKDDTVFLVGDKIDLFKYAKKFRKRRKPADIKKVMIVGGGRTGFYLAKRLSEYGAFVKIIEKDEKRCHYLSNHLKNVMVLNSNGTDIPMLEEENLEEMDAFVSVTGFDETNLLLAIAAKNHGVEDVISKISHESYNELITKLGINMVLNPLHISTSAILRMINGSDRVLTNVMLQGQAELLELYVDESLNVINTPLKDLNLPDYCLFAAIIRGNETIIPGGNDILKPGDHLIVLYLISERGFIEKLFRKNDMLDKLI